MASRHYRTGVSRGASPEELDDFADEFEEADILSDHDPDRFDRRQVNLTRIARSASLLVTFAIAQSALAEDRLIASGCTYANGPNNPNFAFAVPSEAMTGGGVVSHKRIRRL
jgi:hypothetical protein